MSKECENCIKRKTMWCPPSCECMALDEFPYYLDKILALEKIDKLEQENKELKKKYENAVADYELEKYKNSKAIEYIKLNIRDIDYDTEEYDYLMNILEGKDE